MGFQVTSFDYSAWLALYPEFTAITQGPATGLWNRATLLHRNDGGGPVSSLTLQQQLLYLVTAHLATLTYNPDGTIKAGGIVGRINSATQGSISVGADFGAVKPNQAYWIQTQYGAEYWMATRAYRTMRYLPGYNRVINPWPIG